MGYKLITGQRNSRVFTGLANIHGISDKQYNSLYMARKYARLFVRGHYLSPLNLSLSQQENIQTWGAARFKPSARFIQVKTKRYMAYHSNVIYNPSNIQLQKTRSQAK